MPQNTHPCSACAHYDSILRGVKPTADGWCVKRSLYPYIDSPGQRTPLGAVRVTDPAARAKPHIVQGAQVQPNCLTFTPRKSKLSKDELLARAKGTR